MKTSILLLCLATTAIGEKQLKLEDIEKDNLANEKRITYKEPPQILTIPQKNISPTSVEYGFKPMKSTQPNYIQRPPQIQAPTYQYVYPQYSTTQVAYATPQVSPQYQYQQYENIPYVIDNGITQSPRGVNQQYENVPYVVDNRIPQNPRSINQQQYYNQQYLFLQPYASPSNNIQMVVDTKGNVKYFMYVPTQYFSAVKNSDASVGNVQVQSLVPNYQNVGPQIFTQEPDYQQTPNAETQYITQPQLPPQPISQQVIPTQQQSFLKSQYAQDNSQFVPRNQPKSLLDSYVPSILQLQYYKQQQEAQANAARQPQPNSVRQQAQKLPQQLQQTPKTVVTRTVLTRQPIRTPNAGVETTFELPLPFRTQSFKTV